MRFKFDITTADKPAYKLFRKKNPNTWIHHVQYADIIHAINQYYINHALETGHVVYLPFGLGKFLIRKNLRNTFKMNGLHQTLPFNYDVYNKTGVKAFHLNENTDGYTYRYFWFARSSYVKPFAMWKMAMTVEAKNKLRDKLRDPEGYYKHLYRECAMLPTNRTIRVMMEKMENSG